MSNSDPENLTTVAYRNDWFWFAVTERTDSRFDGNFVWREGEQARLKGLLKQEEAEGHQPWYLDKDGYRLDDDQLFLASPWSIEDRQGDRPIILRTLDIESGEASFRLAPWFRIGDEQNRRSANGEHSPAPPQREAVIAAKPYNLAWLAIPVTCEGKVICPPLDLRKLSDADLPSICLRMHLIHDTIEFAHCEGRWMNLEIFGALESLYDAVRFREPSQLADWVQWIERLDERYGLDDKSTIEITRLAIVENASMFAELNFPYPFADDAAP